MSQKTYIALTIGPIIKTITSVKSTKAIWAGSYLFSNIMHRVLKALHQQESIEILMPYPDVALLERDFTKIAGYFPDRLICTTTNPAEDKKLLDEVIIEIRKQIVEWVTLDLKQVTKDPQKKIPRKANFSGALIESYLADYLQFKSVCLDLDNAALKKKGSNAIYKINSILDTLELQMAFPTREATAYLSHYLEDIYYNEYVLNGYGKNSSFPSVIEIATAEFSTKTSTYSDTADDQNGYLQKLMADGHTLKQYHKYITVVQADGDNVGALIKGIYQEAPEVFPIFSKQLLTFSKKATNLINDYGGIPVYIGGDDLLFFAPVMTGERNTFSLINELDELFHKYINEHEKIKNILDIMKEKDASFSSPTLSFGVSMSYYKYPLNEALIHGVNLLFGKAKLVAGKNAMAYSLIKHSGQLFGGYYQKGTPFSQSFTQLLSAKSQDGSRFLSSILHKLDFHKTAIETIYQAFDSPKNQLEHFFDNNFNESIHIENKDLMDALIEFIDAYWTDASYAQLNEEEKMQGLYGFLRFIHFLKSDFRDE